MHDVPSHDNDSDTESILHLHGTFQQRFSALNSGHELSPRRGVGPLPSSSPESPQPLPEGHERSFAHWIGRSRRFPKQQLPGLPTARVPLPCTAGTQCTGLGAKDLSPSSARGAGGPGLCREVGWEAGTTLVSVQAAGTALPSSFLVLWHSGQ